VIKHRNDAVSDFKLGEQRRRCSPDHLGPAMLIPLVTPDLAEKSLPGAAVRALASRAQIEPEVGADLEAFRSLHADGELIESATSYAIGLVWWFSVDQWRRGDLLDAAQEQLLAEVSLADSSLVNGYEVTAHRLRSAALAPVVHASQLKLSSLVSGVPDIDNLTVKFTDAVVAALLVAGADRFGDPSTSADRMRDTMTTIAYCQAA
jgi:hypothetical protein